MGAEELTTEQRAEAQGWNPDYDGPNAKTAEQFIADGEKIAPIQKERNNKLVQDIARLEKKLDTFQNIHMKTIHETREQAYNQAVLDFKKQQREAAEEADADKVGEIQEKIENLKKPEEPKTETKREEISPEFSEWNAENTWYMKDDEMTAYADMLGDRYKSQFGDTPAGRKKFFKAIESGVKKVFPDNFGGNSSNAPDVETPSGGGSKKKGKALPPEAKAAAKKFVAEGLYKSEDEYAKVYWEVN